MGSCGNTFPVPLPQSAKLLGNAHCISFSLAEAVDFHMGNHVDGWTWIYFSVITNSNMTAIVLYKFAGKRGCM